MIISDYDKQMKPALHSQYLVSHQQVCVHHINSNVLLDAEQRWKDANKEGENYGGGSSASGKLQVALTSRDMATVLAVRKHSSSQLRTDDTSPVPHNYRGVLELWSFMVFSETKKEYRKAWARLCDEFGD